MTYGMPPGGGMPPWSGPYAAAPVRPARPGTVTFAVALMLLQVGLSLVGAGLLVANRQYLEDSIIASSPEDAGTPAGDTAARDATTFIIVLLIGIALVVAVGLLTLAFLNLRGNNVGRILTWIFCGIGLCCTGIGALGTVSGATEGPGWYVAYSYASTTLTFVIYLLVTMLLVLPASAAYFRPGR